MKVYWGWVVCVTFLILFTLAAGIAFSYSEIMVPLNKEVHTSLTLLGWMGAFPGSVPMLAAPVAAYVHFRIGCRRTVIMGVLISTISLAFTALVSNIALMILIYGVLGSIGLLFIVNPPFFLLDDYFPYHHPRHVLATSIIACGFPLATLIFNPLTYAFLEAVGWRVTYSIFACIMFTVGLSTAMTFRPRTESGGDLDLLKSDSEKKQYEEIVNSNVTVAKRTRIILGGIWLVASTLKSSAYYTPFVTLVKQMEVLGIPQSQSSKAMSVIGCCEVISRLTISYVGDYIKGKILFMYVGCCLILCLQNALGSLAHSLTHLIIYGAVLGIFGGPIIAAMYSSCSEVLDRQEVPELFSLFRVGLGTGCLIGPVIAGGIFDGTGSFEGVFYLNSVFYFIAALSYSLIIALSRNRPKWVYPDMPSSDNPMQTMEQTFVESDEASMGDTTIFEVDHASKYASVDDR